MLQALLYQVLAQNPTLLTSFRAAFQKSRKLGHNWTYVLLQEVFITLSSVSNQRTYLTLRLYLISDAPEESESYEGVDRTEVLDFLLQLCSPLPGRNPACIFKVLLISRPASDIETTLRRVSSIRMHEQTKRDIEHIVDAGLSLIIKKLERNLVQDDERSDSDYESSDDIAKTAKTSKIPLQTFSDQGQPQNMNISDLSFVRDYLIQNANGVILWVVLILKDLEQTFNTGFWSLKEIKEMLTRLPRDLEQWYVEMIRRIVQDTEREFQKRNYPKHQRLAKTKLMLSWATFAKRAMTIKEFRDVIAISDIAFQDADRNSQHGAPISVSPVTLLAESRIQDTKQAKKAIAYFCNGLLEVLSSSTSHSLRHRHHRRVDPADLVQLLHRSAKDFLILDERTSPFHLEYYFGAYDIAALSLKYLKLSFPAPDVPLKMRDWTENHFRQFICHLKDRPLIPYILSTLPEHIRISKTDKARTKLVTFLGALDTNRESHAWMFLENWAGQNDLANSRGLSFRQCAEAERFRHQCALVAVELKETAVIKLLIEAGIKDPSDVLVVASKKGDNISVRAILERPSHAGEGITTCEESFSLTVRYGHLSIVQTLLVSGRVQPDLRGKNKESGLHIASEHGYTNILDLLIRAGADIEAEDRNGMRPLHSAASSGELATAQFLVESGANLQPHITKDESGHEGVTPLALAAWRGHTEVLEYFLRKYQEMDDMNILCKSAMIRTDIEVATTLALNARHVDILKMLQKAETLANEKSSLVRKPGAQNQLVEKLIGGNMNPRASVHLLSLAESSTDSPRGSKRFSRVFLSPHEMATTTQENTSNDEESNIAELGSRLVSGVNFHCGIEYAKLTWFRKRLKSGLH